MIRFLNQTEIILEYTLHPFCYEVHKPSLIFQTKKQELFSDSYLHNLQLFFSPNQTKYQITIHNNCQICFFLQINIL